MVNLKKNNYKYIIYILFTIFFVFNKQLYADVFEYSIVSSIEDTSLQKAKETAISQSRAVSLVYVIKRIVPKAYNKKIENLINIDNAKNFDTYISVSKESFSGKNYSATITFKFNSKEIHAFLEANNIPYVKTLNNDYKTLIIPTYIELNKTTSNEENVWVQYFMQEKGQDYLTSFLYYNPPEINFLSKKDHVDSIIKNLDVDGIIGIKIKEILSEDNYIEYNLEVHNYKTGSTIKHNNILYINDAISIAIQEIEEKFKLDSISLMSKNIINNNFIVSSSNLDEWINVEQILNSAIGKSIISFNVTKIDSSNVYVNIQYRGNLLDLKNNFVDSCLFLDETNLSLYLIKNCK